MDLLLGERYSPILYESISRVKARFCSNETKGTQMPLGINVDLTMNRNYDSREYCKVMHPSNGMFPIDSMRLTFLDFAKTDGNSNIQMVKIKDYYKDFYVAGSHTQVNYAQAA